MLTWLGLVSVLVEHSLKKIVDIKAALTLDRKYKAARAFIALYDSIVEVERVARLCTEAVGTVTSGRRGAIDQSDVDELAMEVESASNSLVNELAALREVLGFFDEKLQAMLPTLVRSKFGLMYQAESAFGHRNIEFRFIFDRHTSASGSADRLERIQYSKPTRKFTAEDYARIYDNAKPQPAEDPVWSDESKEPIDELTQWVKQHATRQNVRPDDGEGLRVLHRDLVEHVSAVAQTREHLKRFIAQQFTIEDVLYVTGGRRETRWWW